MGWLDDIAEGRMSPTERSGLPGSPPLQNTQPISQEALDRWRTNNQGLSLEDILALAQSGGSGSGDGGGYGGGSGSGGRTMQEDLDYLRAQYGLETEQELTVLREKARVENDYEIQRMIQQYGLSTQQELALLREKYALELPHELALMKQRAADEGKLQDDAQAFQSMESAIERNWKSGESDAQRKFDERMAVEDRTWRSEESEKGRDFERTMATEDRDWKAEENAINREFDLKIKTMDIGAQQALQAARLAAEQAMQNQELSMRDRIAAADRAADKELAKMRIDADERMQLKELTMRESLTKLEIASAEKINREKIQSEEKMQEKGFEHEKEMRKEDRTMERQKMFVDMMGRDPVRAALLAMGVSGSLLPEGDIYADLDPLKGAGAYEANTEQALRGIEGVGQEADITREGMTGIAPIEKQARSFVQGPQTNQTLLASAHGVGGPQSGGLSGDQVVQRALAVTPKGFQTKAAAGGVGQPGKPVTPNTTYLSNEGAQVEGAKPEAVTVGPNRELQSITPLTAPDERVAPAGTSLPAALPVNATQQDQGIQRGMQNLQAQAQAKRQANPALGILPAVSGVAARTGNPMAAAASGLPAPAPAALPKPMNPQPFDTSQLDPQLITNLMALSSNPNTPEGANARNQLMQIIPRLRRKTRRSNPNINQASMNLANLMTQA